MLEIFGLLMPAISSVLNRVIPDLNARAAAQDEINKALIEQKEAVEQSIADQAKAQAEVNLQEAESPSLFVSGWRPFVGWVCGIGCAYAFIAAPFLGWFSLMLNGPVPPTLDMGTIIGLLGGLLGLGGLRTYEKTQGVAVTSLSKLPIFTNLKRKTDKGVVK